MPSRSRLDGWRVTLLRGRRRDARRVEAMADVAVLGWDAGPSREEPGVWRDVLRPRPRKGRTMHSSKLALIGFCATASLGLGSLAVEAAPLTATGREAMAAVAGDIEAQPIAYRRCWCKTAAGIAAGMAQPTAATATTGPSTLKPTPPDLAAGGRKWIVRIAADAAGTTKRRRR